MTRDEQLKDEKAVQGEMHRFERQLAYEHEKPALEYRINAALTPPEYRNVWQWLSLGGR